MADFLLEIGTEEIPAGMVWDLAVNLGHNVSEALQKNGLRSSAPPPEGPMFAFHRSNPVWMLMDGMKLIAAPRRIGFLIEGLPERQEDRTETVAGPAMSIARDASGAWTKAAEGFARKQGVALADCTEVQGPKGPCVGFTRDVKGKSAAEILAEIVPAAVEALYLPKAMRWGAGDFLFVRPVRWVVALLGDTVVDLSIKGTKSGRASRGHRIHGAAEVSIPSAKDYFGTLESQRVLADPTERKEKIKKELNSLAGEVGGKWDILSKDWMEDVFEGGLLGTLVFTCEWPTAFLGAIPPDLAQLPEPIFATCLKEHQKSFAVYVTSDPDDPLAGVPVTKTGLALRPFFLAVMDGPEDPKGLIRQGNENVTVSRLKDAKFFYDHDVKVPLERRLEELKGIVYHPKLGTYYDKALRLEALARKLAPFFEEDAEKAGEAARLCKTDLASLLVQEKEFTSLQGIAGGLYARAQGKDEAVSRAISEHYGEPRPYLGSSNRWCSFSVVVALADKLDTLIQFFGIGQVPTGSKDPFALRRAASEVANLLSERGLYEGSGPRFSLGHFLRGECPGAYESLEAFLLERARFRWEGRMIYPESVGIMQPPAGGTPAAPASKIAYDEVNAVLVQGLDDLLDMRERLDALHAVRAEFSEDFDALSVAHKRAKNLTKDQPAYDLDPAGFLPASEKEGAGERSLYGALLAAEEGTAPMLESRDYLGFLRRLAALRPAVDRFFDDVLVMCDPESKDPAKTALQRNRLALLQRLVALFNRVADLSEIVPRQGA